MLPIYNAISIDQEAIHSGTSKPCIMTVEDENSNIIGNYVVKVFRPDNMGHSYYTNKEVYGSILAVEFELKTPKAALVKVGQGLIDTLNKYRNSDLIRGTYFATEYMENVLDYSDTIELKIENWEIESIFAFDVLIGNRDRRKKKPNLFLQNDDVYLIDHEQAFFSTIDKSFPEMVKEKEKYWKTINVNMDGYKREHLFLERLRKINADNPVNFDTFKEYLRPLDTSVISDCQTQLEEVGNNIGGDSSIIQYLKEVKGNDALFIQLLKDLIV